MNYIFIISTVSNVNVNDCQNSSFLLMGSFASKLVRPSKMASSPEIQQFIKEAVSQEKVVVFSKSYCPYCKLAKEVSVVFRLLFKILITKSNGLLSIYILKDVKLFHLSLIYYYLWFTGFPAGQTTHKSIRA